MWLGPPYMNRKITLFAFAGKCPGFGASGLADLAADSAAPAVRPKNRSRESISTSPRPVKPAPACQRNSRRVRPQNEREEAGLLSVMVRSPVVWVNFVVDLLLSNGLLRIESISVRVALVARPPVSL